MTFISKELNMSLRMVVSTFIILVHFLVLPAARADDQSTGCGLGWKITSKYSWPAAHIRNLVHYLLPSSFSMTSGTSGCAYHTLVKTEEIPAFNFANTNYDHIQIDIAQGGGQYISSLSDLLGCSELGSIMVLIKSRDALHMELNSPDSGSDFYLSLRNLLKTEKDIAGQCPVLG
jgi:hypothetical protein